MSPQDWLVHPLWLSLAMALVHFIWQGALLATLCAIAVRWLARDAQQRYLLGLVTMLAMAACVPLTMAIVEPPTTMANATAHATKLDEALSAVDLDAAAAVLVPPDDLSHRASAIVESPLARFLPWITAAWMAGVTVFSLRLVTGLAALRWLASRGAAPSIEILRTYERLALSLGMSRPPRLVVAQHVRQALAVGFFRPVILLPAAWLAELPPNVVEAVLAHELAHIRRHDLWVNLLQRVIEALLFFHPAVWWISKQIRADREMCCDELAVGVTEQRLAYASALEVVALRTVREPPFSLATGIGGRKMHLLNRVRNVLGLPPASPGGAWWPAGVLALAAPCLVWLLAANGPQTARAEPDDVVIELTSDEEADATESEERTLLERLPWIGRLFADETIEIDLGNDEEIMTEIVLRLEHEEDEREEGDDEEEGNDDDADDRDDDDDDAEEADDEDDADDEAEARKKSKHNVADGEGEDGGDAVLPKIAKRWRKQITAREDAGFAEVEKRLAAAQRQLGRELERANQLEDKQAAAEAKERAEDTRRELEERAAEMKLQYAKRQHELRDWLKTAESKPSVAEAREHARQMREAIEKLDHDLAEQRKKLHAGLEEAAKNQQHDVAQKLHAQMNELNARSAAARHKMHVALSDKIKAQHADRFAEHERELAERRQQIAAEREKIEAHRAVLEQQHQDIEQKHRQLREKLHDELSNKVKVSDDRKLADLKHAEIELMHTDKLGDRKHDVEIELTHDSDRRELLEIVRELRKELQDLRREVRELRGQRGDKSESRLDLKWPEGAPKPKLPKELDARKRKLAGGPRGESAIDIEIEIEAAKRAAGDAALAGEEAAKHAATVAENFAKEASAVAEKVAENAAIAAEKAAKQAADAAEAAIKEAAARAEKAARQAADAIEKAGEKKAEDVKVETEKETAKP